MSSGAVRLQPLARAKVASLGDAGARWAAELPRRLDELAQAWSLALGRALPGGSSSYVVGATTRDGRDVVVKVALPDPGFAAQVAVLRRAAGRGYVRLLAHDQERSALLLEALGSSLQQSTRPVAEQLRLLADTLALAWQPAEGADQPVDKAASLHALVARLWEELHRPCPEAVVEQALDYAERRRAVPPGELVVVHGDPHPANLLAVPVERPGAPGGWCFVDPDGFVSDRAYDLGVVLRDWSGHLDGRGGRARLAGWCGLLADRSGVDGQRIWEWGYLERVSSGLYLTAIGAPRAGEPFLRSAGLLLD